MGGKYSKIVLLGRVSWTFVVVSKIDNAFVTLAKPWSRSLFVKEQIVAVLT